MTPYLFIPHPATHNPPQPPPQHTTNTTNTINNTAAGQASHPSPSSSAPPLLRDPDHDPDPPRFRFPPGSTTLEDIEREILRLLPPQSPAHPHPLPLNNSTQARPTLRDTASSPSPPIILPETNGPADDVFPATTGGRSGPDVHGDVHGSVGGDATPSDAMRRAASVALALTRLGDSNGQAGSVDPGRTRWAPWELERQMQDSVRR